MNVETYKGKVKNGQIELSIEVKLPENSDVIVIVPNDKKPKFDLAEMVEKMPEDYQAERRRFRKTCRKGSLVNGRYFAEKVIS